MFDYRRVALTCFISTPSVDVPFQSTQRTYETSTSHPHDVQHPSNGYGSQFPRPQRFFIFEYELVKSREALYL